ncbi:hypothetical protein B0H10DRAFT_1949890 [Mycena sp. CBHHK59/15]|nr:hypothetical protein B0H10DRAFT_1949890 [Mycena sp. CBHHK59/15]
MTQGMENDDENMGTGGKMNKTDLESFDDLILRAQACDGLLMHSRQKEVLESAADCSQKYTQLFLALWTAENLWGKKNPVLGYQFNCDKFGEKLQEGRPEIPCIMESSTVDSLMTHKMEQEQEVRRIWIHHNTFFKIKQSMLHHAVKNAQAASLARWRIGVELNSLTWSAVKPVVELHRKRIESKYAQTWHHSNWRKRRNFKLNVGDSTNKSSFLLLLRLVAAVDYFQETPKDSWGYVVKRSVAPAPTITETSLTGWVMTMDSFTGTHGKTHWLLVLDEGFKLYDSDAPVAAQVLLVLGRHLKSDLSGTLGILELLLGHPNPSRPCSRNIKGTLGKRAAIMHSIAPRAIMMATSTS